MASVMLSGESSSSKPPFKMRVDELQSNYDSILADLHSIIQEKVSQVSSDNGAASKKRKTAASDQAAASKKRFDALFTQIEAFNKTCGEIFKEVHRQRQKQLNADEGLDRVAADLNESLASAGNLAQVLGDFKLFLETGDDQSFVPLSQARSFNAKSPAPQKSPAPPHQRSP